jgi:hypothetical protein
LCLGPLNEAGHFTQVSFLHEADNVGDPTVAANDQLVAVESDFNDEQPQVRFAQAGRRIVEQFLQRRAEGLYGVGIDAAYGERLTVFELRHLRYDFTATRPELLGAGAQRLVDRYRAFLDGLIETVKADRRPFEFFGQRDELRVRCAFPLPLVTQQLLQHERNTSWREHPFGQRIDHHGVGLLAWEILGGTGRPSNDSRSAVKARRYFSIRYADHSATSVALIAPGDVADRGRGRHVGSEPSSREATPLKGAPTVVCARTSLAVTTRAAPCVRATASRHVVWASSMARGTRAARDLRAARTACRRRSLGRARETAGEACVSLQASLRRQRRNALTARTKQYGLTSRSTGPKTRLSEACPIYAAS